MEQNLNRYKIFYTVAKIGSISHSAEELYISQPAVSKAISRLEDNLGTTLLKRNSRGVSLTDEGKLLFSQLKVAFEAIHSAEDRLHRINELGIGHIRIGASATLCKYLLLPYLKGFVEQFPHIKITIVCQSSATVLKMLREGKLDVALAVKPDDTRDIGFLSIGNVQDIFVATDTYIENLELREKNITENYVHELFSRANLMLLDEENVTRRFVDNYFAENAIEAEHILEVSNMDLLIDFARIGLGIACVIGEFVKEDIKSGALREIKLLKPFNKRTVGFATCRGELTPSVSSFMEYASKRKSPLSR